MNPPRRNLQPLHGVLSDLSRRCWGVAFYPEIPWYGWHFLHTGPQGAGRGQVTAADVAMLAGCRDDLEGGWMILPLGHPAYLDRHKWMGMWGGGPRKIVEETLRLERKLQAAIDQEDEARFDGLLQGTIRWF